MGFYGVCTPYWIFKNVGVWRHMLSPQHILTSATTYAGTCGTYCRPAVYCRWGETYTVHLLSSATIHAKVCRIYLSSHIVERETLHAYLSLDNWVCSVKMNLYV